MSLNILPANLLTLILVYLNPMDLLAIMTVSKIFYQIGNDHTFWIWYSKLYGENISDKKYLIDNIIDKSVKEYQIDVYTPPYRHNYECFYFDKVSDVNLWLNMSQTIAKNTGLNIVINESELKSKIKSTRWSWMLRIWE